MTEHYKPRVAAVGCGYWGKNIIRNLAALDALAAVCDSKTQSTEDMALQYNTSAKTWADILANQDINAVAIVTPAPSHGVLVKEALQARKDVFVEKPFTLDMQEAEELCKLAEKLDKKIMVGHLLQYHPAFLKLSAMVTKGDLGKLQYIYSNRLAFAKTPREKDVLWSLAPHDISIILALVQQEPTEIFAVRENFVPEWICDTATLHLGFQSGVRAKVFASWVHPFKEHKFIAAGTEGMIVFDDSQPWDKKLTLYSHKITHENGYPEHVRAEGQFIPVDPQEPLNQEMSHFLDCITHRKTPRTDGYEGLRVLKILQQAQLVSENIQSSNRY